MKKTLLWALAGLGIMAISLPGLAEELTKKPEADIKLLTGPTLKQGEILRVSVASTNTRPEDMRVSFNGKTTPCFDQGNGTCEAIFGVFVDTAPGSYKLTAQYGPGVLAQETIKVLDGKFRTQNISVSKSTAGLQPLPGELETIQALKDTVSTTRYWSLPLMSPTPDCEVSPFGVKRYHNGVYIHDYHKGVDLRSPAGRPIKAITDGVVKIAAPKFRLHGGTVGLDHGQGLSSVYIHMSKVLVKQGQQVKKGDTIGLVGSTGFATGPHLHWGLYANGIPVNPDFWIPVRRCG